MTQVIKTLFVTVPSAAARRYLFQFPNCVSHQLQKLAQVREDIQIVFLVLAKDYERYKPFLTLFPSERVIVEPVKVNFQLSFIQKIFRFFYAYLLYTNTTRILATMGMRPDEPPAGGNRFLAPLKWLIANTFGRSLFVRKKLVPFLYYRIFVDRPFAPLFQKYRPDLVFLTSIYDRFDSRLIAEAKRRGVKTIASQASWDHLDKYYLPFQSDIFIAHSEQIKRAAVRFQNYDPRSVVVTGFPHFDFFTSAESFLPKEKLLKDLELPPNARYLLYVSGSSYCPDEPEVVETMLSWIAADIFGPEVYLVLRPYLGSRSKDKDFDARRYQALTRHPRLRLFAKRGLEDFNDTVLFMNVIRHASIVMSVYSTVVLESVIYDRPLLTAPFDGYQKRPFYRSIRRFEGFEHFQDVIKSGGLRRAFSFSELKEAIGDYLANPSLDGDGRERMRRELCYRLDGRASERIVKVVVDALFLPDS
jgi:CDP-glycerol glycerophosphotransferase (TagB/SpsB family)